MICKFHSAQTSEVLKTSEVFATTFFFRMPISRRFILAYNEILILGTEVITSGIKGVQDKSWTPK